MPRTRSTDWFCLFLGLFKIFFFFFLCSLFSVLCSLFSVLCSLFSVLSSLFSVLSSLSLSFFVVYKLYSFDNRGMNWQSTSCHKNCSVSAGTSCFYGELSSVNWQHPPYSIAYPEIVNIYNDFPCVPVNNTIHGNRWCHTKSKSGGQFIDRNQSTIHSWKSSIENNSKSDTC